MTACRWGGGCTAEDGHGRFGYFCEEHAGQLAEIRSRRAPTLRTRPTVPPKPPKDGLQSYRESITAEAQERVNRDADALVALVRERPLTRGAAAKAMGLSEGRVSRAANHARSRGELRPSTTNARAPYELAA